MFLTKLSPIVKCVAYKPKIFANIKIVNLVKINMIHTYKLTPNINLYSENVLHKNEINENKPLVIIMPWMLAKSKHLSSFTDIYMGKGCDVLVVNITPLQLLWPQTGAQVVAKELFNILRHIQRMPILVHGFSIGAYVWAETLLLLGPEHPVLKRVQGQVWDSAADFATIAHGLSFATFPNNLIARYSLKYYILFHTTVFHYFSVRHYEKARDYFFTGVLSAPTLIFCAENDLIGTASANRRLKKSFESKGIDVQFKCWEKSKHVKHLNIHRDEYLSELNKFLSNIHFPPAIKAKL